MRKFIVTSTAFSFIWLAGFSQSTVPGSSPTNPNSGSSPTSPSNSNPSNGSPTNGSTTPTSTNKNAPTNKYNPSSPSSTPTSSGSTTKYANGADKNFHFGISIVPSLFWASPGTNNNTANSVGLGFAFGINLEFYFTQNYGFVTGLNLANIPSNYTNSMTYKDGAGNVDSTITTTHKYVMQYVEIPLLLKFRTLPIGLFRYFAIAGFDPGIRTSSKDDVTVSGTIGGTSISRSASGENINSETSIIRLSYVFGAGVEYNIAGTTSLQGIISYDAGFLNVNTGSNSGNITSKGVTLTLGVLF
jgi:hypothetical protein